MKFKKDRDGKDQDALGDLGDFIEKHFKKGVSKVSDLFKDNNPDDEVFSYLRTFMDDKSVAAISPSSKFVVKRAVKAMDLRTARVVVEFGAAEGVMTRGILEKLHPQGTLLSIELNDRFYRVLSKMKDSRLKTHCGDVRDVDKILKLYGIGEVDVIVSGIPISFLTGRGRHELLTKVSNLLHPGGRFVVAPQYTTHLIPLLDDYFKSFKTEFEIRNFPPSFIFTAIK